MAEQLRLSGPELAWFDQVYRTHQAKIFRVCLRFGAGDRDWALDRSQDVFMKLVEHIAEVDNREDPGGWLYRVAVTTCYMALRRQRTWGRLAALLAGEQPARAASAAGPVEARELLQRVEQVLAALPPKQRAVTVLVDVEGKSQNEAAALLSLSKGQVSKLHKKTRELLAAQDWQVSDG